MDKPKITELKDSYGELKTELKEKYSNRLRAALSDVKDEMIKRGVDLLGEDFFTVYADAESLGEEIAAEKKSFFESEEYKSAQKKLKELKEKKTDDVIENADGELGKALAKITTLNITINNRLKAKTEVFEEKSKILEEMLDGKKEELVEAKDEIINAVKAIISDNLNAFNAELKDLNGIFGVNYSAPELPFDEKNVKLEFSLFPFENRFLKKSDGDDGKTFIASENRNLSKN